MRVGLDARARGGGLFGGCVGVHACTQRWCEEVSRVGCVRGRKKIFKARGTTPILKEKGARCILAHKRSLNLFGSLGEGWGWRVRA